MPYVIFHYAKLVEDLQFWRSNQVGERVIISSGQQPTNHQLPTVMLQVRWVSQVLAVVVVLHNLLVAHMTLPLTSPHFGGIHLPLPPKVIIDGHDLFVGTSP